jgi:hypothetical protein
MLMPKTKTNDIRNMKKTIHTHMTHVMRSINAAAHLLFLLSTLIAQNHKS